MIMGQRTEVGPDLMNSNDSEAKAEAYKVLDGIGHMLLMDLSGQVENKNRMTASQLDVFINARIGRQDDKVQKRLQTFRSEVITLINTVLNNKKPAPFPDNEKPVPLSEDEIIQIREMVETAKSDFSSDSDDSMGLER